MLDTTIGHIKSFFAENSTLVMSFEEAGQNATKFFASVFENTSFLHTWNKTLQETVNFIWKIQIQIFQKSFQYRHFFYRKCFFSSCKFFRNMSSAVCASSMYSRLCMKMSSFLFVRACAVPRIFIMWNSISGLDTCYHFRLNISCGVAATVKGHPKKHQVNF